MWYEFHRLSFVSSMELGKSESLWVTIWFPFFYLSFYHLSLKSNFVVYYGPIIQNYQAILNYFFLILFQSSFHILKKVIKW